MSTDSGGSDMEVVSDENWITKMSKKNKSKKRIRKEKDIPDGTKKAKQLSQEDINRIILGDSHSNHTKTTKEINTQKTMESNTTNKNQLQIYSKNTNINNSPKMKEIIFKKFKHIYYLSANENYTRTELIGLWEKIYPEQKDIIISTKKGFILKTNNDKVEDTLGKMTELGQIECFKESSPNSKPQTSSQTDSYSVVIASVQLDMDEKVLSEELDKQNLKHRYCKRIVSKATQKPTTLIRIITGSQQTFETLLAEGFYFKYQHYPVYPSKPPVPLPQPCKKCLSFDHPTDSCNNNLKCTKCFGSHSVNKCTSTLPPKCTSCNSEEHQAWSLHCPKRPTKPIEGIPNIQIKSLNKKSNEISPVKRNSRIHSPVTIHDCIINTYINKLNDTKNVNREELLSKLKKRFVNDFNIDTNAVFSGSRVYILMFDLETQETSPTEPINGLTNIQHSHVIN